MFRILCHFDKLSKKEMTQNSEHYRALDSGPAVRNGIDATSDGIQTVIKNEIREEINDEQ